jgi:Tfp pilus assembly protein PilV
MKFKNGQMMIEVLFALSVVVLVLLALIAGTVISLKNVRFAKEMTLANHYAQQAMENVRAYRTRNGFEGLGSGGSCYSEITPSAKSPINCTQWGDIPETSLKRRIMVEDEGGEGDKKKITATIAWTDSDCSAGEYCHQAAVVSYFTQWSR